MRMLIIFPLFLMGLICQGQEHKKILTINYGLGNPISFSSNKSGSGGGCSCVIYTEPIKPLTTIGFGYLYQTNNRLFVETGLSYSYYKNENNRINDEDKLINLLLKLRHTFGRYLFLNYGLSIDFGISHSEYYSKNNYSGLGANLGLGGQYYFKNNLGIFLLPNLNYSGLISPETQNRNNSRPLSLYANASVGLTYTLNKAKASQQNP
jgi:hypothetical protein